MPATKPDNKMLARLMRNLHEREVDPLRPLVDEYLLKRDRSPHRVTSHMISMRARPRPGGRISPSAIGGCERQAVFRFTGTKGRKLLDPDFELLCEQGNWTHHKWDVLFLDMEAVLGPDVFEVVSYEKDVRIPRLYVAGALDVHVRIYGVDYIIDIKSISTYGFRYINDMDEPRPDNVRQIVTYMKAKKINRGILWYENRDNQLTRGFVVDFSREEYREAIEWIESVLHYLERQRLPSKHPDCAAGMMRHSKCPWAKLCYGTKYDAEDLRAIAYKNFVSLDAAWKKGLREYKRAVAA